jgi:predicted nucleic acid-binding protein
MHTGGLPDGTTAFIDANIFLHTILGNTRESEPCANFLSRVDNGILNGTTSVLVLNEVLHRLLIASVVSGSGVSPESAVSFLKKNPATVRDAAMVWELIEDILNIRNLDIFPVSAAMFQRSLVIMQDYGLLGNDALHVASMEEHSITTLVTYDRDFENISGITVWNPGKVK